MTDAEKKEKPRTAAVLAQMDAVPVEKQPEKKQSFRDGLMFLAFAITGIVGTVKWITPPPLALIIGLALFGAFGTWNMSNEWTRLEAKRFVAVIGDAIDRILGRGKAEP